LYCRSQTLDFSSYSSLKDSRPEIALPSESDFVIGGHAVLAVGYDDDLKMPGTTGMGALLIRNSWGQAWGVHGYRYLPYEYVEQQFAADFWTIFNESWIAANQFK
jgi:C1A family cysteine protease